MLEYLKDKRDVGFFLSVQALMQTCRFVFTPELLKYRIELTYILEN
jgi:hypothetical protein